MELFCGCGRAEPSHLEEMTLRTMVFRIGLCQGFVQSTGPGKEAREAAKGGGGAWVVLLE